MDKIVQPAPPFVGVPAATALGQSQATLCDLVIGPRYHVIWVAVIATGGAGKTLVLSDVLDLINVKVNGTVVRAHKASELDALQTSFGLHYGVRQWNYDAGSNYIPVFSSGLPQAPQSAKQTLFVLPIFFCEPWRKGYAAQEMYAWPTAWQDGSVLKSFQLEIFTPNTGNVDSTKPFSITGWIETDTMQGGLDANKVPVTLVTKINRTTHQYSAAGDFQIYNLSKAGTYLQHTFFSQTGDDIARIIAKKNSAIIRDVFFGANLASIMSREINATGISEQRFDLVYDYDDLPSGGLNLDNASDYNLTLTMANAAATNKVLTCLSLQYAPIV